MLSMIRSGPKILLISTPEPSLLAAWFKSEYQGVRGTFIEVFDGTQEDQSIVILTPGTLDKAIPLSVAEEAYSLPAEMEQLLCGLISSGMQAHVRQLRMATRMILFRSMGDMDLSLKAIAADYPGETGEVQDLMNRSAGQGAVVALTPKPLHLTCGLGDLHPEALYIPGPYGALYRQLRGHALKYLNAGIGNRDWTDLEIRIYDRVSAYQLHYKRLLQMIEALELGLILGEGWGKDSPRFMMTVDVYRVRLMTFLEPAQIKRYLVGLEYLEDGMRIADHDVYLNRRKIYWNEVAKGYADSREALGRLFRSRILDKLTGEEAKAFLAVEAEIRKLQSE